MANGDHMLGSLAGHFRDVGLLSRRCASRKLRDWTTALQAGNTIWPTQRFEKSQRLFVRPEFPLNRYQALADSRCFLHT